MNPLPKVLVLGASGNMGKATIRALVGNYKDQVEIFAGTRNVEKFGHIEGVQVVEASMGDAEILGKALQKGKYQRVFVVTPGAENRVELVQNGLKACKLAKDTVEYVLVLSALNGGPGTVFFDHHHGIEKAVAACDMDHTIVRLQYFASNFHDMTTKENVIFDPRSPDAVVAFGDRDKSAKGCAKLLAECDPHHFGKAYTLTLPPKAIRDIIGRDTKYQKISYDEARQIYLEWGMGSWQVDGLMELYRAMDDGKFANPSNDLGLIL